jgi:hypothetical protein
LGAQGAAIDFQNSNVLQLSERRRVMAGTLTASRLAHVGLFVNAAIASGRYDAITVDHVYAEAHRQQLFDSLRAWLGADGEPLSTVSQGEREALNDLFMRVANAVTTEDLGFPPSTPRGGLALVMGMLLEGIREVRDVRKSRA